MKKLKKFGLLIVGVIGFIFGSRAGRKPYESIEAKAREITHNPRVQRVKEKVDEKIEPSLRVASDKAGTIKDKLSGSDGKSQTASQGAP